MKNCIEFMQDAWFGDRKLTIDFPENWYISVFFPQETGILSESEIQSRIDAPIGFQSLRSFLDPGDSVLIICDDISRPTRTDLILPILIDRMEHYGISRKKISILISSGTHERMDEREISLKLGKRITEQYPVHLHHYNRGNVLIGHTSPGTPVYVNRLLQEHSLIIGVGGIVPHHPAGFGGGAKLILGVCGIKTIMHFHRFRQGAGTGGNVDNEFRRDMLEAARMAGMNFIVNTLINRKRGVIEVVSGDVEQAFNRGVSNARKLFSVPHPGNREYDLVIADTYPFDASFAFTRKGWWPVMSASQDCHKLIISAMPKGMGEHLIYPIPNHKKIQKLVRLYYELKSFGIRFFFTRSIPTRVIKILEKTSGRKPDRQNLNHRIPGNPVLKQSFGLPGADVCYLHNAKGSGLASLTRLPYRLFDSPESYFEYLGTLCGDRPLRVAIYRASSLTFPSARPG